MYNMGTGGPRPGMLRILVKVGSHALMGCEGYFVLTMLVEADLDFGGAGGFQQSGGHPALGMNSYGQVVGNEC